jgi:hypothetical protein
MTDYDDKNWIIDSKVDLRRSERVCKSNNFKAKDVNAVLEQYRHRFDGDIQLTQLNYFDVSKDGNCFFNVLATHIYGSELLYEKIKLKIGLFLKLNKPKWIAYFGGARRLIYEQLLYIYHHIQLGSTPIARDENELGEKVEEENFIRWESIIKEIAVDGSFASNPEFYIIICAIIWPKYDMFLFISRFDSYAYSSLAARKKGEIKRLNTEYKDAKATKCKIFFLVFTLYILCS